MVAVSGPVNGSVKMDCKPLFVDQLDAGGNAIG